MAVRITVNDPGPAHSAKNTTGPGLPNQPTQDSKGNIMVDLTADCPDELREAIREYGSDPVSAYHFLAAAVRGHLRNDRHPQWLGIVVTELDAAMVDAETLRAEAGELPVNPRRRRQETVTVFDVLQQHGPWRLAGFAIALTVFLLLHLIRWPVALAARLLLAAQTGLDQRLTNAISPDNAEHVRRNAHV